MGVMVSRGSAATVTFSTPQEIIISHADDSIRIGDGTNLAAVTAANELKVAAGSVSYAQRVDEASATITYVGKATPGTAEGSAAWQIQRITDSSGDLTIEWADGDESFDNVWTNRASLSYS